MSKKSLGAKGLFTKTKLLLVFVLMLLVFPLRFGLFLKDHSINFYGQIVREKVKYLADMLKVILTKFDKVLDNPEYNYVVHSAPNLFPRSGHCSTINQDYHWHIELFPRLTLVAGFEWGTGFYINPMSPEVAANYLREEKSE